MLGSLKRSWRLHIQAQFSNSYHWKKKKKRSCSTTEFIPTDEEGLRYLLEAMRTTSKTYSASASLPSSCIHSLIFLFFLPSSSISCLLLMSLCHRDPLPPHTVSIKLMCRYWQVIGQGEMDYQEEEEERNEARLYYCFRSFLFRTSRYSQKSCVHFNPPVFFLVECIQKICTSCRDTKTLLN